MGSVDEISKFTEQKNLDIVEEYGPNLKILPMTDQVKELQTILRDRLVLSTYYIYLKIIFSNFSHRNAYFL